MNIVEKCNGHIRAHACADGSKQQCKPGYKKEDGASLTVATNSIMITAAIDADERQDIATMDIPGTFLSAYNDEKTIMLLKGCLVELIVQADPQLYCKYVIYDKKNQALLYVELTKALYSLLKSALLFYKKFVINLQNYESPFITNPYDPCVANATVAGTQMTVTWHVDDLKTSHINPFQNTKFAIYLASIYGESLVVHLGKVHDYLGMDLNYSIN
jgi:hypothetical protein